MLPFDFDEMDVSLTRHLDDGLCDYVCCIPCTYMYSLAFVMLQCIRTCPFISEGNLREGDFPNFVLLRDFL